jgi:heme exporter protein C
MGIIGFVDVIVVYFSVQWWPGIHPSPVIGPLADTGALDSTMQAVLLFSFLTFLFFLVYLIAERMALRDTEERVKSLRFSLRRAQTSAEILPGE